MKPMVKITRGLKSAGRTISKHSPLLLTLTGIAGVGVTAYFAYKSAKKVEVIVEEIEADREAGIEVDRVEVAKDVAGAIALPVLTGLVSIAAIGFSYRIQNVRIGGLASALTAMAAEHKMVQDKIRTRYGDDAFNKLMMPTHLEKHTEEMPDGEEVEVFVDSLDESEDSFIYGRWFHNSSEWVADDKFYNERYVISKIEDLENKLFRNGFLTMNEAFDILGFDRTLAGGVMGWGVGEFQCDYNVTDVLNAAGYYEPRIFIRWNAPKAIHSTIEYRD